MTYVAQDILKLQCKTSEFRTDSGVMPLLDHQNSEFKTQLHENSVIDLTQNVYPGNPGTKSNRERQNSNPPPPPKKKKKKSRK